MAKSTLAKSLLSLVVKSGETAEGKDVFKKVRIGFISEKAEDEKLFELGLEVEKVISFKVQDIVKENSYTIENVQ